MGVGGHRRSWHGSRYQPRNSTIVELHPTQPWPSSAPAHWTAQSDTRPSVSSKSISSPDYPVPQGKKGSRPPTPRQSPASHLPRHPQPHREQTSEGKTPLFLLSSPHRGYQTNMDWEKEEGDAYPYYVYGAACSEVEVDCLTGAHKVERCWRAPKGHTNTGVLSAGNNNQLDLPGTDTQSWVSVFLFS